MRPFTKIGSLLVALTLTWPSWASGSVDERWLELIKARFPSNCFVVRTHADSWVIGNNGYQSAHWFVQTCQGSFQYNVIYYPHSAFPLRVSPYEVMQIAAPGNSPVGSNISFKADGFAAA